VFRPLLGHHRAIYRLWLAQPGPKHCSHWSINTPIKVVLDDHLYIIYWVITHNGMDIDDFNLKCGRSRILSRAFNYYFWNSYRLSTPVFCPRSKRRGHLRQCAHTTTLNFYSSFVAFYSPAPLSPSLFSPWIQSMPHCLIKVRIQSIIRCKWKFKK
jgi:hypothetical protein